MGTLGVGSKIENLLSQLDKPSMVPFSCGNLTSSYYHISYFYLDPMHGQVTKTHILTRR